MAIGCCAFAGLAVAAEPTVATSANPQAAYAWHLPPGFPLPAVPDDNPMSPAKVALGCRLFFDTRLSATQTYSCASCHQPQLAFTDGRARAVGATGETVRRGAMTLTNVAYNPVYTWASSEAVSLEAQMTQPLFNQHPLEMGLRRDDAGWLARLAAAGYGGAFHESFPDAPQPLSADNVIRAIAAFERTLISGRSAFDRYVFDDDREALSPEAKRGMELFYSKRVGCAGCHFGINFSGPIAQAGKARAKPLFADTGIARVGQAPIAQFEDAGFGEVTHEPADAGKFRVPTLRNVALTAPYMHDGSIATLDAVIDHYAQGGRERGGDRSLAIEPVALTPDERRELVAFLDGLTDDNFVAHARELASCPASPGATPR